jgi:tetratricopeptide (TPR) repeat protein
MRQCTLCRYSFWLIMAFGAFGALLSPTFAHGQNIELQMNDIKVNQCQGGQTMEVTVLDEKRRPLDRQSVITLHERKSNITTFQTTASDSKWIFCDIDFGDYDVDVSAVGYLVEHKQVHVVNSNSTLQGVKLDVVLRKDPSAVDLDAADSAIPPNARKATKKAVDALKSANYKQAEKDLEKVYKIAPSSGQVNFLYGYLYLRQKDYPKAETYLKRAVTIEPRRAQALTLLGRVQLEQHQPEDAQKTLEQAVRADSSSWMAHNLLSDAYLREKDYEKSREQAQLAIDIGKGSANAAQLVLGQALANLGHDKEAIAALNTFLKNDPGNPSASGVQAFIRKIQDRDATMAANGEMQADGDLALAAAPPTLPESAWGPPAVDDVKPLLVPGITCPTDQVIQAAGDRVKQLVDNITRFAAVEDLVHEQLDKTGNPFTKETRKFNYVASITEPRPGFLSTEEYRDLRYGISDLPDHIVTTGFMSLALIFHPDMRGNFDMVCEGLGDWQGHAAWLVHFRQRDDKPSRMADYIVGSEHYPIKMKGRAWINANNLQIVRIESDLVSPLPQLSVEHEIAEYGPVNFANQKVELWLPQKVDIFFELRRHRYYRQHSFDHYMLFSVNSTDQQILPKSGQTRTRSQ